MVGNADAKVELVSRLRTLMPNRGDAPKMSQRTGIPKQTIQNWINGIGEPSLINATKLADATGANLLWLATGRGEIFSGESALPSLDNAGIEEAVLVESIRVLYSVMNELSVHLSSETQARIVSAIYDEHLAEGRPVSVDRARRYIKLVVGG